MASDSGVVVMKRVSFDEVADERMSSWWVHLVSDRSSHLATTRTWVSQERRFIDRLEG